MKHVALSFLGLASLTSLAAARTDLEGCVSSKVIFDHYYASYIWYVPENGEICSILNCGGGRAPPSTTQPGCPEYSGTEPLTSDYLEGWGPNGKQAASTSTVASTASSTADTVLASATQTSEALDSSSASSSSPSGTQPADSMITDGPSRISTVTSSTSVTGSDASTSAAASSSSAPNAATTPASNVGGAVAVMAAVVGAMVL
ncbi:hypothetical protein N7489_011851 [Penicillium chrysogenum]|jgi:cobalamin biosynthesis Mg chelatase CobN|uniref:Siderophore biosynthesis enzyme n=1 Tax=Penicillium chrysogenum TaxID=5076 RepID=A0ABQ8W3R7_PENCH|nr:uncharacterized protein N7489_011851 [Penicillium chrysogenum]KAJ5231143.1 hypothetical protein N7489_011851 [Penicillium chrysogenum]KAJ5253469.1 hypothetical protein N7505_012132 [Penicillium chrysogenum]KAJ6162713.1 hypothetical protein N7497_002692 [Penicillium chrysogenum]